MKQLYNLYKNKSSLELKQIEQLELDKVFDSICLTKTHFGSQYLFYLITQFQDKFLNVVSHNNKNEKIKFILSQFNRHRHSNFVDFIFEKNNPFKILEEINVPINIALAIGNLTVLLIFIVSSSPIALIVFIIISFINGTIYFSHKLLFFYARDTVLCVSDIYGLNEKLKHEGITTPDIGNNKSEFALIKILFNDIRNPFLNEFSAFLFFIEALKSIFLIDFFLVLLLFRKIEKSRLNLIEHYFFIGKLDVSISLIEFKDKNSSILCAPQFNDVATGYLKATKLINPIITDCKAININIRKSIVITGHNASGKSALIKSIIINWILGATINMCFAQKFEYSFDTISFLLGSSDNTSGHESLYQYELKKLEKIVNSTLDINKKNLILLDEVIRGTNEVDREKITLSISKYLSEQPNNELVISTHNINLAKMLVNYGFTSLFFRHDEEKETGLIIFKYQLIEGIELTTNARELLQKYSFPNAIIDFVN